MTPDIERTIVRHYPQQALVSPLEDAQVVWDYDTDNAMLRAVIADLSALDPEMRNGTRGRYDISEEVILFGELHLLLCYLGPYAALSYQIDHRVSLAGREREDQIGRTLERHGISVLSTRELEERVPWIRNADVTVWHCLFVHPRLEP